MYRVLIASDQQADIDLVHQLLNKRDLISEILVSQTLDQANSHISQQLPDFAFIDPRMYKVAQQGKSFTRRFSFPVIVMGYSSHCAVRAFDQGASDFLMRPLNEERIELAVSRVLGTLNKQLIHENRSLKLNNSHLSNQLTQLTSKKLVIRETGRIRLIDQNSIRYVKGAGNYVEIFLTDGNKIMHRGTLRAIENELDPLLFCRIHKSALIKMSLVEELKPTAKGDYHVRLRGGDDLTLSRNNKDKLKILLESSGPIFHQN